MPSTIYNDKQLSYEQLLIKDGKVSIHHRNIQMLAAEMFKMKNEMFPEIISDIFKKESVITITWDILIILKHLL